MLTEEQKNSPFNEEYDKITEAEVVYDFVERSSLGRDLNNNESLPENMGIKSGILFKAKTYVTRIISRIMSCLPSSLVYDADDMEVIRLKINEGDKRANYGVTSDNAQDLYIAAAYSDKLRMDIKTPGMFEVTAQTDLINVEVNFDTPYPCDDVITVYLKKS